MDTAFSFKVDDLMQTMMLNVAGPGHLAEVLLPLLENGRQRVIMNMSTGLASIGLNYGAKCATYSISKVALNMLVRVAFLHLLHSPLTGLLPDIQTEQGKVELYRHLYGSWLGKDRYATLVPVSCLAYSEVWTEMGGPGAMMEPRESVDGIIRVLRSVTPADSGKFFRFDGNVLPW